MVIGTVQGDVHDIGKAIVIAYLKANGYEVTDLGRDVSADSFHRARQGTERRRHRHERPAHHDHGGAEEAHQAHQGRARPYKTVVGGAPATQRWADQIGADAYAEDANDGVKKIDALLGK